MTRETELPQAGRLIGRPDLTQAAAFETAQQGADGPAAVVALPEDSLADVGRALTRLTKVVLALYPAWLPEAKGITGPAGAGQAAVVEIARAMARRSPLYGPVLEALAVAALRGEKTARLPGVAQETIARVLGKLIRSAYGRPQLILVLVAPGQTDTTMRAAEHTALWLAQHLPANVWLCGPSVALMPHVSIQESPVRALEKAPEEQETDEPEPLPWASPLTGRPNPCSVIEQRLEAYLAAQSWSEGRTWNTSWHGGATENPILIDIMWEDEQLVVEIDGPEHRAPLKFATDRRRDRLLQLAGFAVLRFTNSEVEADMALVASQIERFLTQRRAVPKP